MSQTAVARAIGWLLGRGYLRVVEMWGKLGLFLFGTRALINRRRKRRHDPETSQTAMVDEVAKDIDDMLAPDEQACPDCGRSWLGSKSMDVCEWCVALAAPVSAWLASEARVPAAGLCVRIGPRPRPDEQSRRPRH